MIRVMVVDDSPLVRRIATDILSSEADIAVVATAATAEFALAKLDRERPDVITLDMEMPGMGGLEAIRRIMAQRATPIVVLSAHARRGAELTLQALDAGAVEFVLKPESSLSGGLPAVARELVDRVRDAARSTVHARPLSTPEAATSPIRPAREPAAAPAFTAPLADGTVFDLVAIGTSTGGPVALKEVLVTLPADFPLPVVVVQHMPPVFTKAFADRLNGMCAVRVKEAANGDPLLPGTVLIAPGAFHLTVSRTGGAPRAVVDTGEPVSGAPALGRRADPLGGGRVWRARPGRHHDGHGARRRRRPSGAAPARRPGHRPGPGQLRDLRHEPRGDPERRRRRGAPPGAHRAATGHAGARGSPHEENDVSLADRYHLDRIRNRSAEMVHDAVERLLEGSSELCHCEECALDLVAYALNRVTPRYSTSLLEPLAPDPALERRIRVEIDLALASGVKRLKEHPHHG